MNGLENKLPPAFSQNCVPIFLSSSEYYLPYCAVAIQSLLDHMGDYNYDIVVMTTDASDEKKCKLHKMVAKKRNVSLRFLNIQNEIESYRNRMSVHSGFTIETFFRLLVPFLGKDYEKILFLDSDIVVKEDVAKLYHTELGENLLGAVKDPIMASLLNGTDNISQWNKKYVLEPLKLKDPSSYFNAGILLFNCKAMRKKITAEHILEFAIKNSFYIFDQDVLNVLCEGQVVFLDCKWNAINLSPPKPDYLTSAPLHVLQKLMAAHKNPAIIHYTDKLKPWNDPSIDKAEDFWCVARTTPFFEVLMFRMYKTIADKKLISVPVRPVPVSISEPQPHLFRRIIKRLLVPFFPYGSKRRELVKNIYRKSRS